MHLRSFTLAACVFAFLLTSTINAQSDYGSIAGFVKDPSGAVVPKVKVLIKNEATAEQQTITTNESGYYAKPNLQPGYYTVSAEASGFKKYSSSHNQLSPNSTLSLDISLALGSATETVEVSATNAALQTESGAVQSEVTSEQVDKQELNGRNPIYIAQLLPGVRGGSTLGDFNFASTGGMSWQINGSRTQDSLVTFDGAPAVRTRANGAVIGVADVDTTQEIQVMTADYAAEYGRAAGGQIRIITKTGTRDFHGSAYEYFRNSELNANTWTRNLSTATNFASPFRYNNFGFTAGGPIWMPKMNEKWREKLFFFVGEDWIRYRATDTQTQAVPTMLMRQGDFSELLSANPWYKAGTVVYDPKTCPSLGSSSCVPFPNNVIPTTRLSPNGVAIMSAYPQPTPGYPAHPYNQRKGTLNIDILARSAHRIG
jgi:Carboxypeptidase regulatory-like domain/TonB-dependent Receptor Plug Domain